MVFFGAKKHKLNGNTSVGITEVGKKTAEQQMASGRNFAILSMLNEHSPRTIRSISDEIQMEYNEVVERIKILAHQGYVRVTYVEDS